MSIIPLEQQLKPFIFLVLAACFISLNIIYGKTNANIGNKKEVQAFRGMLVSFMLYCLVDLRLIIGDGFYKMFPRIIVLFLVSLGFAVMSVACYFWFKYVYAYQHRSSRGKKIGNIPVKDLLHLIPLVIALILLFTPLHVFVYELTDTVPVFKPVLMFILLLDYVYLIAATVISVKNLRKAGTRSEKKKFRSQIIFILFFTLSGMLIGYLLNLPAIELCVIPVVMKIFAELQDSQIYTDALTKLYNRRRMTELMGEELSSCSEENPLTVIMLDLDNFKSINDILGHDEGDKALVAFSKALRMVLRSKDAIASRWGGDEFVVAARDKELTADLRELLTTALEGGNLAYSPQFSIGSYTCTSSDFSFDEALANADEALYREKEIRHKESSDFIGRLNAIKNSGEQ